MSWSFTRISNNSWVTRIFSLCALWHFIFKFYCVDRYLTFALWFAHSYLLQKSTQFFFILDRETPFHCAPTRCATQHLAGYATQYPYSQTAFFNQMCYLTPGPGMQLVLVFINRVKYILYYTTEPWREAVTQIIILKWLTSIQDPTSYTKLLWKMECSCSYPSSLSNTGLTLVSGLWMKRWVLGEQSDTKQGSVHRVLLRV